MVLSYWLSPALSCIKLSTHPSIADDPKQYRKALAYNKAGLWRYRVGDYRINVNLKRR